MVVSDTAVLKLGRGPTLKISSIGFTTVLGSAANEGADMKKSASTNATRAKHWVGLD